MDSRARLTPVDVAWISVGVFILGILVPPIYNMMNANAAALDVGDAYMLRMVIPGAIIAAFVAIMAISAEGA